MTRSTVLHVLGSATVALVMACASHTTSPTPYLEGPMSAEPPIVEGVDDPSVFSTNAKPEALLPAGPVALAPAKGGELLWNRRFLGSQVELLDDGEGGVYVVPTAELDAVLGRVDISGRVVWASDSALAGYTDAARLPSGGLALLPRESGEIRADEVHLVDDKGRLRRIALERKARVRPERATILSDAAIKPISSRAQAWGTKIAVGPRDTIAVVGIVREGSAGRSDEDQYLARASDDGKLRLVALLGQLPIDDVRVLANGDIAVLQRLHNVSQVVVFDERGDRVAKELPECFDDTASLVLDEKGGVFGTSHARLGCLAESSGKHEIAVAHWTVGTTVDWQVTVTDGVADPPLLITSGDDVVLFAARGAFRVGRGGAVRPLAQGHWLANCRGFPWASAAINATSLFIATQCGEGGARPAHAAREGELALDSSYLLERYALP